MRDFLLDVLLNSAGYGEPDYTVYSSHMGLLSNSNVLDQVIDLITFETGVTANVSQAAVDIAA